MKLTDAWLRNAKPKENPYKKADGGWLYIVVTPEGSKLWRVGYRFEGKEKTLSIGQYPLVSLADAREARDAVKKQLLAGINPSGAKRAAKVADVTNSFESVAREWHEWKRDSLTVRYAGQVMDRLTDNVFPEIGRVRIERIEPPRILAMLRKIEERGALTMAARVKEHCSQIFRYAIVTGRAQHDPCIHLRGILKPSRGVRHHPSVPPDALPRLLRDIDGYEEIGGEVTHLALKLTCLTLLRTSELRAGEWDEIEGLDGDTPTWRVPSMRMKMRGRDGHLVPLSRQAVAVLRELRRLTGHGRAMFPGKLPGSVMNNNTMLFALYRMGYRSRQTTHGFRTIASTILNEAGWHPDAIERQLAHEEGSKVRRAYNAARHLRERREMLQWYADYLDAVKEGRGCDMVRR